MATDRKLHLTPEQYLVRERLAEAKSEYYRGEVFAMARASLKHNLIVTNLVSFLAVALRRRDCRVFPSDMRLLVSDTGFYTYPEVMVVCGTPLLANTQADVLTNPMMIVEVLSESTKDYDRGGKFPQYMRIPSLQEYLTVSQSEMMIDQRIRQADNSWLIRELVPANGNVPIECLGIQLDFNEVYDKVKLEEPAE